MLPRVKKDFADYTLTAQPDAVQVYFAPGLSFYFTTEDGKYFEKSFDIYLAPALFMRLIADVVYLHKTHFPCPIHNQTLLRDEAKPPQKSSAAAPNTGLT